MFKVYGQYEIKLINKDTGKTEHEEVQKNLISDLFLKLLYQDGYGGFKRCDWYSSGGGTYSDIFYYCGAIILSSDTKVVGKDYRRAGSADFVKDYSSSFKAFTVNETTRSCYIDNLFSPPGSPYTTRIIGIKLYVYDANTLYRYFPSFIELSVPITQQVNQYLYVKYTLFFNCSLINRPYSPNNHFLEFHITKGLVNGVTRAFGTIPNHDYNTNARIGAYISQFLEPANVNNLGRAPTPGVQIERTTLLNLRPYYYRPLVNVDRKVLDSSFALQLNREYQTTDFVGPIGSVAFVALVQPRTSSECDYWFMGYYGFENNDVDICACYGYSPIQNNGPSFSRVFIHPVTRPNVLFSDPEYPSESRGSITLSGANTTKWPIVGKIKIVKTGDASDIVDETFTADPDTDEITVNQSQWATGDKVRVSSTGTLPAPLAPNTDYYVIRISDTKLQLAETYQKALDGDEINITDAGSGTHTISRQNTGTYKLELMSWTKDGMLQINQLNMMVDARGKAQPAILQSQYSYGEGGSAGNSHSNPFSTSLVQQVFKYGNYIYSTQVGRVSPTIVTLCRWPFNSLETSEVLHELSDYSYMSSAVVVVGSKAYISVMSGDDGLYEWDLSDPVGNAPVRLNITGINKEISPAFMTSNTAPWPFEISRSGYSSYEAWNAFDGSGSTYWRSNTATGWLQVFLYWHHKCTSYSITAQATTSAPKDWTFEGSTNGTDWTILDTVTGETAWSAGEKRTYNCDITTSRYCYFRINVTANNGGTYLEIREMNLYSDHPAITELAYDEITGKLWAGHFRGLSKIDLSTMTATQYLRDTGGELENMAVDDVFIRPGQLYAHSGYVLRGGQMYMHYQGGATSGYDRSVWLLRDGTGWYKIKDRANGCCIRKSTGQVIIHTHAAWETHTVTITGKGTGSTVINDSKNFSGFLI